jgi:hypothetical protein
MAEAIREVDRFANWLITSRTEQAVREAEIFAYGPEQNY